jgi:cyanophycinase
MTASTCLACLLLAAVPPAKIDSAIERHLRSETRILSERFLDGATNLSQWQQRRSRLHRDFLDMLGLWPLPERTPLKAAVTGTLTSGEVVIEKLHFQSRPGLYVTGNLYRPKDPSPPTPLPKGARGASGKKLPAILYVCGHSGRGRDGNKTAFQDHGMWFARNGYVCLLVDTLQLGEVKGVHHGTYNLGRWWWHSLAYTPAGVECWNGIRAIDYLVSRPEVDASRIGVTGISGGGASTMWIAAADDRVKVAVPVSGMSDLESYVSNKVINGHCDCMFTVNCHRWEWTTIAALIAPRPMLFANSDNDRIFPMDGNRRIIARLRKLYEMYGKSDLVDEYVSKGGHDYRPDLRVAIFKWINKHLKGDNGPVKDADDKPLPGKQLRVFPEDSDLPKDSINAKVDELFIPRARVAVPEAAGFATWKAELLKKLRAQSFRAFPERLPAGVAHGVIEGSDGELKGRLFYPEWDVPTFLSEPVQFAGGGKKGLLVVLSEGDAEKPEVPAWLERMAIDHEVRLFVPRGTGRVSWTRKNPPNYVERAFALLGQTVDQGRVRDVVEAVRWLEAQDGRRWSVAGRGQAGILAAYAALFEPSIAEVVAVDPPSSHLQGPHFLGVLRVLDIPQAMGLLAPRPLALAGKVDPAFNTTALIYDRAGARSQLFAPGKQRERIDPDGLPGTLLVIGQQVDGEMLAAELRKRAGGDMARMVVLSTEVKDCPLLLRLRKAPGVDYHRLGDDSSKTLDLSRATGVLFLSKDPAALRRQFVGTPLEKGCQEVIARKGVVGGVGLAGAVVGEVLLPDALVEIRTSGQRDPSDLPAVLAKAGGRVGYEIAPNAVLEVRDRSVRVWGDGNLTIHLAASSNRPAARMVLDSRQRRDLTSLRRAARDRADTFPPAKVAAPVVEKGTLVIIGGGGMPAGLIGRFVEMAGGKKARIVVLPTAMPGTITRDRITEAFRKAGAEKVTLLPGRTLTDVESEKSLAALKEATGIWFGGGRQWRFIDAYEGTKVVPLMFDVLKRGGVIGGSSAGATIQGDYLCRGGFFNNFDIMYEGYERGLAFLPGVAIDQHFAQRKRFADMTVLRKTLPQYLGIGLDEATAIIVRGSVAEVVGRGKVHFYDANKPVTKDGPDHESFAAGGRYDLKARKALP